MKNKSIVLSIFLGVFLASQAFSQQEANNVATTAEKSVTPQSPEQNVSNLTLDQDDPDVLNQAVQASVSDAVIKTVLLDDFETPQGWQSEIPFDFGVTSLIYKPGSPEEIASEANNLVLGVKVLFFRRNFGWMDVNRPYPLAIRNVVRTFSLWVAGRNRRHELFLKVRDIHNNRMKISLGEMVWQGWKKVIAPVKYPVVQFDSKISRKGLDFFGFHIEFNGEDIVVTEPYYIYFDYLTATMDFTETIDSDDMADDW